MAKLKMMRRLRGRLYLYQSRFSPDRWNDEYTAYYPTKPWDHRSTEGPGQSALLIKEMEEANHWGRLAAQLYFGWFALLFIANALGIFWLLMRDRDLPRFSPLVFAVFFISNLIGMIATSRTGDYLAESDLRIRKVIERLTQRYVTEVPCSESQSPVPLDAINTGLRFTGAAFVTLLLFWAALEIWWVLVRLG